jgi:hypothetical protein
MAGTRSHLAVPLAPSLCLRNPLGAYKSKSIVELQHFHMDLVTD